MCGRTGSAGAGRDGPNIRKIPKPAPSGRTAAGRENPQSNADRPDRRRPEKSPNQIGECCLLLLLLLLSSPHGKAGSAGNQDVNAKSWISAGRVFAILTKKANGKMITMRM